MDEKSHEALKAFYRSEAGRINVPPFPSGRLEAAMRKHSAATESRRSRLFYAVAAACVLLFMGGAALSNSRPSALAGLFTDLNKKFDLEKIVPAALQKVPEALYDAFHRSF